MNNKSDEKVLDVIHGYTGKYDIERIAIIKNDEDKVVYSGELENFLYPTDLMQNYAYKIKMAAVSRVLNFNNIELIIFI